MMAKQPNTSQCLVNIDYANSDHTGLFSMSQQTMMFSISQDINKPHFTA